MHCWSMKTATEKLTGTLHNISQRRSAEVVVITRTHSKKKKTSPSGVFKMTKSQATKEEMQVARLVDTNNRQNAFSPMSVSVFFRD